MKRVLAVLFLGLMFLLSASYNSYAEMRGCAYQTEGTMHRHMGTFGSGPRLWQSFKGLGLDEKQKQAIREIGSTLKKETVRKRADIQVARIELKDILRQDNVNMSEAEAKLKQIASLHTDVGLLRIKAIEEIKSKLTPEQRTKLREHLESHGGWRHGDRGRKGFRDREDDIK